MIDTRKIWAKIKSAITTFAANLVNLFNRPEQTLNESDTLVQIQKEDPLESVPVKEVPNQAPPAEQPQSFPIWRNIITRLPNEYDIPNSEIVHAFAPMTAEYYRHLFPHSSHHPHLLVDEHVWTRIILALPRNYSIPEREMT